jgi:hypothetical protein
MVAMATSMISFFQNKKKLGINRKDQMSLYVSPSNQNFGIIESIPSDTANKILQSINATRAATTVTNLNTVLYADEIVIPANIITTTADTRNGVLIQIQGWTNEPGQWMNLVLRGGLPPSRLIRQEETLLILPHGTISVLNSITSPVIPAIYTIPSDAATLDSNGWIVSLPSINYAGNNSLLYFTCSFYLHRPTFKMSMDLHVNHG